MLTKQHTVVCRRTEEKASQFLKKHIDVWEQSYNWISMCNDKEIWKKN